MPSITSNAELVFRELQTLPETARVAKLESYLNVNRPTFELEWLDFKRADKLKTDDHLAHIWAKAVTAFANTGGGLVIWGIDCRVEKVSGIDAVLELAPAPDVFWLQSQLQALITRISEPPVQGIEFLASCKADRSGYLVAFVPPSSTRPHRSLPKKEFLMRVGSQCDIIPIDMLRRMFYPQKSVQFRIYVRGRVGRMAPHNRECVFVSAQLYNCGKVTADDITVLVIEPNTINLGLGGMSWSNRQGGRNGDYFDADRPLHPGDMYDFFNFQTGNFVATTTADGKITYNPEFPKPPRFKLHLFCRDHPALTAEFELTQSQIEGQERIGIDFETYEET